jgi:TRAP-type C4-dicarboxylate transport system permease small subunit
VAKSPAALRAAFERLMEWVVIALMVVLFVEVTLGVVFRMIGRPLVWYDEIASVLLAWLTYYAATLAALKRAHIGFPGLVRSLAPRVRVWVVVLAEAFTIGFFVLLAWVGWTVLAVLATDYLVSLPDVSNQYVQSVIPIGATLFVIAELLLLPETIRDACAGRAAGASVAERLH